MSQRKYLVNYAHSRYDEMSNLIVACRQLANKHRLNATGMLDRIESTLRLERHHFQIRNYRWKYWNAIYKLLIDFVNDPVDWFGKNQYEPVPQPGWFYHKHHLNDD